VSYCFPFSSPRLGQGGSPEREPLAWARPFSLSEELGEAVWLCGCFWNSEMIYACLDVDYCVKCMRTNKYAWVMWFMNYKWWFWAWTFACEMNEVIGIKLTRHWYEMKFHYVGWEWWADMDSLEKWKRWIMKN